MADRTLKYTIEAEDNASAVLNSVADAGARADESLAGVATSAGNLSGAAESASAGTSVLVEGQVGIAEASDEASLAIEREIQKLDLLLRAYQDDAEYTSELTERKSKLLAELSGLSKETETFADTSASSIGVVGGLGRVVDAVGRSGGDLGKAFKGAAPAIVDVVQDLAGVASSGVGARGALSSLVGVLSGAGGISLALSVASAAFVLFQDVMKDAKKEADTTGDDLEKAFAGLIELSDAIKGSFELTFEGASVRVDLLRAKILETRSEIEALSNTPTVVPAPGENQADILRRTIELQVRNAEAIERAEEALADYNKQLEIIELQVGDEALIRARITELEKAGLVFSREKTAAEKEAAAAEERRKNALESEVSILDTLRDKRDELLKILDIANEEELRQLSILEREVATLEANLLVRKRLFAEEQRQAELRATFGENATARPATPAPTDSGLDPFAMAGEGAERAKQNIELTREGIRGLSDETIAESEAIGRELEDGLFKDVENFISLNERLSDSISGSLAEGVAGFGEALADVATGAKGFEALGQSVLLTLADLGARIGAQLIAFGVAGVAIKKFVTNPVGAIIAGAALIAASRVLKSRVEAQIKEDEDAVAGGSVSDNPFTVKPIVPPAPVSGNNNGLVSGTNAAGGAAVPLRPGFPVNEPPEEDPELPTTGGGGRRRRPAPGSGVDAGDRNRPAGSGADVADRTSRSVEESLDITRLAPEIVEALDITRLAPALAEALDIDRSLPVQSTEPDRPADVGDRVSRSLAESLDIRRLAPEIVEALDIRRLSPEIVEALDMDRPLPVQSTEPDRPADVGDRVSSRTSESFDLGRLAPDMAASFDLGRLAPDIAEALDLGRLAPDVAEALDLGRPRLDIKRPTIDAGSISARIAVDLRLSEPFVLPGGTLLFAIREALQTEAELGGLGTLN